MTAAERVTEQQPHPLRRGASADTVFRWLLPEDRERFMLQYSGAEAGFPPEGETGPEDVLERYRQLAVLQADPDAFRAMVRRVDELTTGVRPDEDEPLAVTRARTGI